MELSHTTKLIYNPLFESYTQVDEFFVSKVQAVGLGEGLGELDAEDDGELEGETELLGELDTEADTEEEADELIEEDGLGELEIEGLGQN